MGGMTAERLVALCATLLHDIGHGPYSHTFETIFQTNHEEITIAIITSPETEVFQVLNQVAKDSPRKWPVLFVKTILIHKSSNLYLVRLTPTGWIICYEMHILRARNTGRLI